MSTEVSQASYADLLENIQEFYAENAIVAHCPIANTKLKFKPLTVKQLKNFIELQVTTEKDEFGIIPGIDTVKHINQVILDNCTEVSEDMFHRLTPFDRDAIVLQLRAHVKDEADVVAGEQEIDTISLKSVVDKVHNVDLSSLDRTKTVTLEFNGGNIGLHLRIPNIVVDSAVNEHFKRKISPTLKKGKKRVEKEIDKVLSTVYFLELSKYIDNIQITKNGKTASVVFDDPGTLDASLELLEELPSSIVAEVSRYIGEVKEFRDSIFCYTDSNDKEVPLNVDISLFTGI
tara:strand:- start:10982 stop:11848 length:867 start_codon:yes stop_codon:yes gene_type:complete